jgi:hypothetical protein
MRAAAALSLASGARWRAPVKERVFAFLDFFSLSLQLRQVCQVSKSAVDNALQQK